MNARNTGLAAKVHCAAAAAMLERGESFALVCFPRATVPQLFGLEALAAAPQGPHFVVQAWAGTGRLYGKPIPAHEVEQQGEGGLAAAYFAEAPLPEPVSYADYKLQFEALQAAFAKNDLQKAILSRVKRVPKPEAFHPVGFFEKLDAAYPDALVYLLAHPAHGIWLGATPEVLLAGHDGEWLTHSLAGTQPWHQDEEYAWADKEIEEQELVSAHIREVLKASGLKKWREEGPETLRAGSVVHLRSTFAFEMREGLAGLPGRLHPTPAVAGLPVAEALQAIKSVEPHDRGLYTGYLGVQAFPERAQLYVNLRCMQVGPNDLALYVGGGITRRSVAAHEWDETEHKALTLLKLLHG